MDGVEPSIEMDQTQGAGHASFTYDGAGTVKGDGEMTGRGSDTLRYDGLGTLKSATVSSKTACYTFAPDGALLMRVYDSTGTTTCTTASATTNYLLGDLFETNASGTVTTSYQDGPAGDLTSFNGIPTTASTPTYLYYSGHGDLAAEANSSGTRTASHTYDPFGAPIDAPPANVTSHRYTGGWDKQDDTTTGLILMGARPYDPTLGRFIAVDPIDGGSLNNYDYAGQDPINGYDLSGLFANKVEGDEQAGDPLAGKASEATSQVSDEIEFTERQLMRKFKHASDFGVDGNNNRTNRSRFQKALTDFLNDPETTQMEDVKFRGQAGFRVWYNNSTRQIVIGKGGQFVAGWTATPGQFNAFLRSGNL